MSTTPWAQPPPKSIPASVATQSACRILIQSHSLQRDSAGNISAGAYLEIARFRRSILGRRLRCCGHIATALGTKGGNLTVNIRKSAPAHGMAAIELL
jgi:hypothetical protein